MTVSFAPLEGITGWVFRSAHHDMFPGLDSYYTPFWAPTPDTPLAGRGLADVLPEHNEGVPLVPQLLTNRAESFLPAARMLRDLGYREVNLNLGCPSGTVVSKKKGSGFLSLPRQLEEFFTEVFSADLDLRISVKTRVGLTSPEEWPALLELYNRFPICELTVHPRIRQDFYREPVRRETFAYAVEHTKLPLCYNGDLNTVQDCRELSAAFPTVNHLMLGRGLIANPALARELSGGPALNKTELRTFHDRLLADYQATLSGPRPVLGKMKELWFYLSASFLGAEKPLKGIRKARDLTAYAAAADAVFRDCELCPGSGTFGRI
ncbi:MAG: tRNA-dihydrouridine synthase family protein [Ruminiclostridium sp.]|nr:tRNA-dihydrouridine synthase family protein [Ruminiclostridium sp.]